MENRFTGTFRAALTVVWVVGAMSGRAAAGAEDDETEESAYEQSKKAEKRADPFADVGMMFDRANWPTRATWRPLLFPRSMVQVTATFEANLSSGAAFEPFSLAPDIYYGVSEKLTIGVIHSSSAYGAVGAGNGICLSGTDAGCAATYQSVGVDALYGLTDGTVQLVAHGGVDALSLPDPTLFSLRAGIKGRWNSGKIQVICDPHIRLGITERDFNDDALGLPLEVMFQATPKLAAGVHTGMFGPFDGLGDALRVPVGAQVLYGMSHKVDIGGALSLVNLFGTDGSALSGGEGRVLNVFASYRL